MDYIPYKNNKWKFTIAGQFLKIDLIIRELHGSWRNNIFTRACLICA